MKLRVVFVLLYSASAALAQEDSVVDAVLPNSIFFAEHLGQEPSAVSWLNLLPYPTEDVGYEPRLTRLILIRPEYRVYFVSPDSENSDCPDAKIYLHPAAKYVEYAIPLGCQEPNYLYPEDIGFAVYELGSRTLIEVGWGEPAGPKFRLLEVTATDIVEVACNDC